MKYYIVINEWNYPVSSGREIIGDYDTLELAIKVAEKEYKNETENFLNINKEIYQEGLYHSEKSLGYCLFSSQYESENMWFRSWILELEHGNFEIL